MKFEIYQHATDSPVTLEQYTDRHRRVVKRSKLLKKINSYDINIADLDKLERLAASYTEIFDKG